MKSNLRDVAGSKTRVQNVTGDQTVKATPGVLRRLVISNANAAVQTLTLKDGASTIIVIQVPATTTISLPIESGHTTSIVVNPSHANIDALVLYD